MNFYTDNNFYLSLNVNTQVKDTVAVSAKDEKNVINATEKRKTEEINKKQKKNNLDSNEIQKKYLSNNNSNDNKNRKNKNTGLLTNFTPFYYINNDGLYKKPVLRRYEKPEYPPLARRKGEEGIVELLLKVSPGGQVVDVSIINSSGSRFLDRAAVEAARKFEFYPAVYSDKKIYTVYSISIRFELE
ncbi:energy transducer TonB [Spirochaetia bacterium 38H-sp]|uniref:Energy transducer TonB n=1 Tax=Rarispira pelagica TaxID=3141764 RepID=A0ABU9U8U2_9SPIR